MGLKYGGGRGGQGGEVELTIKPEHYSYIVLSPSMSSSNVEAVRYTGVLAGDPDARTWHDTTLAHERTNNVEPGMVKNQHFGKKTIQNPMLQVTLTIAPCFPFDWDGCAMCNLLDTAKIMRTKGLVPTLSNVKKTYGVRRLESVFLSGDEKPRILPTSCQCNDGGGPFCHVRTTWTMDGHGSFPFNSGLQHRESYLTN